MKFESSSFPTLSGDGSDLPSRVEYAPADRDGVATQKQRLAVLASKRPEWIKCPANDNQDWPLAQWLRKDGNEVLLRVAERYRAIYDAANTEALLIGTMPDDMYNVPVDRKVQNRADGSTGFGGPRRIKGAVGHFDGDDGTYKVVAIDEDVVSEMQGSDGLFPRKPAKRVPKKWNGDRLLIEAIDSKKLLVHLQGALGPLLEPFENAVLHGETLSSIGERKGGNTVSSGPIGRAYVMDGLAIIQEELRIIDRVSVA